MIQIRFYKFVGSKCGALLKEAMKKGIAHKKVKQPPWINLTRLDL